MTVQLSLLLSEVAVTTAEPFLRAVTRPASTETMSVGETLHNTVWSVASGAADGGAEVGSAAPAQLQRVLAQSHLLHRMMSGSGRGVGGVVSHSFLRASRAFLALLSV